MYDIKKILVLLLAVVVHRRKHDTWPEKDTDDIRENIISYQDEGGGEGDTGYDLTVLHHANDNPIKTKETLYKQGADVPNIGRFLENKKDSCDLDPNNFPFDNVRYYAYEGDGNSTGSLSSLASCKYFVIIPINMIVLFFKIFQVRMMVT